MYKLNPRKLILAKLCNNIGVFKILEKLSKTYIIDLEKVVIYYQFFLH